MFFTNSIGTCAIRSCTFFDIYKEEKCEDLPKYAKSCPGWAKKYCNSYKDFMTKYCKKSCGLCSNKKKEEQTACDMKKVYGKISGDNLVLKLKSNGEYIAYQK